MTDSRTAIVTGAGRGIGAGVAKRLAADGFSVAAVDIDESGCLRVVEAIRSAGGRALAVSADVADEQAVTAVVARVAAELGPPTVLVNGAGIMQDNILFAMSSYELDEVMNLHLCGSFLMTRAVQAYMSSAGWGRIVNLSSTSAPDDLEKATLWLHEGGWQGFTTSLATELGEFGVTVNGIVPGFVETEISTVAAQWLGLPFDAVEKRAASRSPVRRMGGPEDVAHAVSFFVSEGAGLISGEVLHVAGRQAA